MLKRTIVRLLLFGIPFGLSYWATKPAVPVGGNQALVVCAYPGDRPGELRISLDPAACSETDGGPTIAGAAPVSVFPAMNIPQGVGEDAARKSLSISF
jgi:hypothetical protein